MVVIPIPKTQQKYINSSFFHWTVDAFYNANNMQTTGDTYYLIIANQLGPVNVSHQTMIIIF